MIEDENKVEFLLSHGANPNLGLKKHEQLKLGITEEWGEALNRAASHGSLRTFDLLLQHGARLERSLALHFAAKAIYTPERKVLMEWLISMGFDVNHSDTSNGWQCEGTPLHCAATCGRLEMVQFLLENGADPSAINFDGCSTLDMAWRYEPEVAQLLKSWVPRNPKIEEVTKAIEKVDKQQGPDRLRSKI